MDSVLVIPVGAGVFASTLRHPHLLGEVAFGTRQRGLDLPVGVPAYIHIAPDGSPSRDLLTPGAVVWRGSVGRITPAVTQGPRRGMHPDPGTRPPFAETYDYRDAETFVHVTGLTRLDEPVSLDRFRDATGAKLFGRCAPQWISQGVLLGAAAARSRVRMLRAA